MNQFYQLLKEQIITFDRLILDKYQEIGLNETEAIILMKLNNSLKAGKNVLVIADIIPNMTLTDVDLSKTFVELVNRGYINVEMSDIDASETYNLDGTYLRLSEVFDGKGVKKSVSNANVADAVQLIETEIGRQISALDFEIIQKWFLDYQYSLEDVQKAFAQAQKNKKVNVKYIDRILYNSHNQPTKETKLEEKEIRTIFNKVYGKNK